MLKRASILIIMAGILITAGFGCKGLTAEQAAATKPVVLEYWTVYDDVGAINRMITGYRALRPYLTVNVRQLRAEELYPRLIEALADDKAPDILSVNVRALRQFQSRLAPMPGSVRDTTIKTVKSQLGDETLVQSQSIILPTLTSLDSNYVQAVKKDAVINGSIYGLPLSLDTMALFYNKDLLDRAGVPQPPTNWDEFSDAVKKITKISGTGASSTILQAGAALGTGNNIPAADDLLYVLFEQSSLPFVSSAGYPTFNSAKSGSLAAAFGVLNFYTDFANDTRDTYTWNEQMDNALDAFVAGKVGFFFGYSYQLPIIKARGSQLNLGILPLPQLNSNKPVNAANYSLQTVPAKSAHPNEAWAVINYLSTSPGNGDYLAATGRPTALREYVRKQGENLELRPFLEQLLTAQNWYRGKNYEAAQKAVSTLLHDWINVPTNASINDWRQKALNNAASKIGQSM